MKMAKLSKIAKPKPELTKAGSVIDIGLALRILGAPSMQMGDRIAEKAGEAAFQFVKETQGRAEQWGERLKLSEKQYQWLRDIYEKVRIRKPK